MVIRFRPMPAAIAVAFSSAMPAWADSQVIDTVVIRAAREIPLPAGAGTLNAADIAARRSATSDSAQLLQDIPGMSLYGAGGVSSLPAIHGLADDRLRTKVDGMDLVASCPNHMNSPLSYIDPTNVGTVQVYAGITPVSVGGDSIGGSIVVNTPLPTFAAPGKGSLTKGEIGAFYRSNGNAKGANLSATYATESFNVNYAVATAESDNVKAAGDFKTRTDTGVTGHTLPLDEVGSTAYKTRNHTLGFALKGGNHLFEAKFGYQDIPYELYPNQRMDMLGNAQHRVNLRYLGQLDWGTLEARAYHETVNHSMDFGPDKQFDYGTMGSPSLGMPMKTEGKTNGVSIKANIDLSKQELLRVGAELQNYRLNDWWPAVADSMMMGPNAFLNINDGKRKRTALFGEWEKRLNPQWLTLLGLRYERVKTNAGMVHGYEQANFPNTPTMDMMNQGVDASSFNNANRNKTDNNWDLTALARYTADTTSDVEFGVARKVRSPNLYERYSWSTASMMAIMNNFVGDGNGYVGDIDLKPEKAHTLSVTFDWHAAERDWEIKATPYYTRVTDYIDAVRLPSSAGSMMSPSDNNATSTSTFVKLRYANQSARLYGLDLSGHLPLGKSGWGEWGLKGLLNYTNGKNLDTGNDLYNIMPLNAKLTLTHKVGAWDNGIELVAVRTKNHVSDVRNEVTTAGYSLVNLRASYAWQQVRVDVGIENLFDKFYSQPLGGAYVGQGATMGINSIPWGVPVTGIGRSIYTGLTVKF
jgi:iron complex outermembrane receptor protein